MQSFHLPSPKALIFDLGGVFTTSKLDSVHFETGKNTISFDRLTRTSVWMSYECGKISEDECYSTLAESYGFPVAELYDAIKKGRERADYDKSLISFLSTLKKSHGDSLKILMMTNISQPDYQALKDKWGPSFWSVFDRVFASSENGVRKPSPRFYYKVLQELRVSPRETFFVDDLIENMITAKAIGIRGLLFQSSQQTISVLTNLLGDPMERGRAWLKANARKLDTTTDCGAVVVKENYSQLLIYEATRDL
jgi:epoxide hydrolase-like predicted phosphatase